MSELNDDLDILRRLLRRQIAVLDISRNALENYAWYVDRYGDSRKDAAYLEEANSALNAIKELDSDG
jgi:hypothetical protein